MEYRRKGLIHFLKASLWSYDDNALGDEGGSGGRLVLPGGRKNSFRLVVTRETVNPGLGENETEFSIAILSVPFEMLPDGDGLLDHVVEILGDLGRQSLRLQDAQNFRPSHKFYLSDSVRISQDDANLRGGQTLLSQLVDLLFYILRAQLKPGWQGTPIRQSALRNTLSGSVHTTHL